MVIYVLFKKKKKKLKISWKFATYIWKRPVYTVLVY